MDVVVSLLRSVNLGAHNRVSMADLRELFESLKLRNPQTYIQSGNIVFQTAEKDQVRLASRIETGIQRRFGFQSKVILRTLAEMKNVVAKNPFAGRPEIEPNRLLVTFLARDPTSGAKEKVLKIKTDPEELKIEGREVYIYYPNGLARPKIPWTAIEKALDTPGTGRNWNTVMKLVEIAASMQNS